MRTDHNDNPADYLGDSVYVAYNKSGQIELRTDTHESWPKIFLEPEVYRALVRFVQIVNPNLNE